MWAFSLGSGTSGGVLAPLLMIGGACGELAAHFAHASARTASPLGSPRHGRHALRLARRPAHRHSLLLEITHCLPALLPLILACIAAYVVTSLIMPRSILTEKLSRRGYHLTREYGTDPLETVSVLEIMTETEPQLPDAPSPPTSSPSPTTPPAPPPKRWPPTASPPSSSSTATPAHLRHHLPHDLLRGRKKSVRASRPPARLLRHPLTI